MRVAVYHRNADIRIEDRPIPSAGPGEIVVRTGASGICGSDVMEWYRIHKAPLILGHEVAGTISETGPGVTAYASGDRVVVSHHVPCNTCRYCLAGHHAVCDTLRKTNIDPGGFAEYFRVPSINVDRGVLRLPDEVSDEEGSMVEPLACAVRALRLARFRPGQTLLVLGSGVSGLLFVLLGKALGAGRIIATDVNAYRLEAAEGLGATGVIHAVEDVPSRVRQIAGGWLADLVLICTGHPAAISQAWLSVERGGTVVFFAPADPQTPVVLPVNDFWKNETTVMTSYAAAPGDMATALELIRAKAVPVVHLITHRLPFAETGKGFSLVAGAGASLKVIIEPGR